MGSVPADGVEFVVLSIGIVEESDCRSRGCGLELVVLGDIDSSDVACVGWVVGT